jgi:hypothetical protein
MAFSNHLLQCGPRLDKHLGAASAYTKKRNDRTDCAKLLLLVAHACLLSGIAMSGNVALPTPNKFVIVFKENKSFGQIIGSKNGPDIYTFESKGVLFESMSLLPYAGQHC